MVHTTTIQVLSDEDEGVMTPAPRRGCGLFAKGVPIVTIVFISSAIAIIVASISIWATNYVAAVGSVNAIYGQLRDQLLQEATNNVNAQLNAMVQAAELTQTSETLLLNGELPDDANFSFVPTTLVRLMNTVSGEYGILSLGIQRKSVLMPRSNYEVAVFPDLCTDYIYGYQTPKTWPYFDGGCVSRNETYFPVVYHEPDTEINGASVITLTENQWTDIWVLTEETFMISWESPVFNSSGLVWASTFAQKSLKSIDSYFQNKMLLEPGAFIFVLERLTGQMVACSIPGISAQVVQGIPVRYAATDVSDVRVSSVSNEAKNRLGGDWTNMPSGALHFSATLDGDVYFVDVLSFDRENLNWIMILAIPRAIFMEQIDDSVRLTAGVSAVVVVVTLLLTFGWTRWVVRPLVKVAGSMERLAKLEFDEVQGKQVSTFSEIRNIQNSFAAMRNGVYSFSKYVPVSVVRDLLRGQISAELGVTPVDMTVMFIDIKDFTTLCEALPPYQTAKLLGEFLTVMSNVIIRHQGTVDKYIGDAIMAFWNAPQRVENHEVHACAAALQCYRELKVLHQKWSSENLPLLEMRIGMHTSEVLVGNIGSPDRMNYTVIGDGVNLASRMEAVGKQYGLCCTFITDSIAEKVKDNYLLYLMDSVTVKGRRQVTLAYQLVCELSEAETNQHIIAVTYAKLFKERQNNDKGKCKELMTQLCELKVTDSRLENLNGDLPVAGDQP